MHNFAFISALINMFRCHFAGDARIVLKIHLLGVIIAPMWMHSRSIDTCTNEIAFFFVTYSMYFSYSEAQSDQVYHLCTPVFILPVVAHDQGVS